MSLRGLYLLVLTVLVGTAASVRWYLEADAQPLEAPDVVAPAPAPEHVPLPLWAEPARTTRLSAPSRGHNGVARGGQALSSTATPPREDDGGGGAPEPTAASAFRPPLDPR